MLTFTESHIFTRPITATYTDEFGVEQTAAIDEPRFDYLAGEPIGLKFGAQDTLTCPLTTTWYSGRAGTYIIRAQAPVGMLIAQSGATSIYGVGGWKTNVIRWSGNANLMVGEIDLFPNSDVTAEPSYVAGHLYQPNYIQGENIDDMLLFNNIINGDWT